MSNLIISIIGFLLAILLACGIIILIVYSKIKKTIGTNNIRQLTNIMSNITNAEKEEYTREKNVKGMTNLLEPEIIRDFPEFNKSLIFSVCENNLRKIFDALENLDISKIENDDNFVYLKSTISDKIKDMKTNGITEKYDDIQFNRHAISSYKKVNGKATIEISTTLDYYYTTNKKDQKSYNDVKKQTRYTSEFVYVYDEAKFNIGQNSFSVHCPNCGAPLKGINVNYCEYCGNYIEKLNLKAWKMCSYKEDYK